MSLHLGSNEPRLSESFDISPEKRVSGLPNSRFFGSPLKQCCTHHNSCLVPPRANPSSIFWEDIANYKWIRNLKSPSLRQGKCLAGSCRDSYKSIIRDYISLSFLFFPDFGKGLVKLGLRSDAPFAMNAGSSNSLPQMEGAHSMACRHYMWTRIFIILQTFSEARQEVREHIPRFHTVTYWGLYLL